MAFKWASYPAAGPGKWKCKFKEHYSLLAFWTWPCISLLTTLTESYLQLDSLIAIPSLSEILQACHWGISVIKCQRPQQLAESRTPTSSHICQSDTLISPPALFHFPSSLARLFFNLFSHVSSTLYSPVSDLFTLVQKAARLWLCVPMLPLHVSHCPEVVLLFWVPVGSVHCNSAVSCKQTSLIGHCYS